MDSDTRRPIALVGLMGAGKSAVARIVGARLGRRVADLDEILETESGCTIAELFARHGEPEFRRREAQILERTLADGAEVLACGGGVVLGTSQREVLRSRCRTVWLEVEPAEAERRVRANPGVRPLLAAGDPGQRLAALLGARAEHYAEVAAVRVSTDERTPEAVADLVLDALGEKVS